jgi:hypothetical protein
MNLSEVESISFSRDGFKPHVKSPIIWGNKGCEAFPLCYLTKPKWMPKEMWEEFLDNFTFEIRKVKNDIS